MRIKNNKYKFSILTKFALLTSILIATTSIVVAFFLIKIAVNQTHQNIMEKGVSLALITSENSEYSVYTEDNESLRDIVEDLLGDKDVIHVRLLNKDNKILIEDSSDHSINLSPFIIVPDRFVFPDASIYDHKMFDDHMEIIVPIVSIKSNFDDVLIVEEDVASQKNIIGHLQIGMTLTHLEKKINQLILSATMFTALFVIIGILLAIFLANKITSPIRKLNLATKRIADNNLDHFVEIQSSDEIFDLATSFNNMIRNLKNYRIEIEKHSSSLSRKNVELENEIKIRKTTEISLAATKARLQHLIKNTPAVIYSCKPSNLFKYTFIGENIEHLCRYNYEELMKDEQLWVTNIHEEDRWVFFKEREQVMISGHSSVEYRIVNQEGNYIWVYDEMKLIYDSKGIPFEIVGYVIEVSKRKLLEEKLINDATHDSLTGLPNRLVLLEHMNHFLAHARKNSGYIFALIFIDLDRFKKVNDSLGHVTGDKLLVSAAQRLRNCIHEKDIVVRLGGDEFAVILDDIKSISDITPISNRIIQDLSSPFQVENQEIYINGSLGITLYNSNYENPEQMLRDADLAMYDAKAKGGGCHVLFDISMHDKAVRVMRIETDLQHAIEREELFLLYQPVISGTTGMVEGFEALLRWDHPQRGLMNPMEFIPIAEDTGLIIPIGNWVLETACRQMSIWQQNFPALDKSTISVNISSTQFTENLIKQVNNSLRETKLDPGSLILEITESIIMDNPDLTAKIIMELKDINVRLQIDDFGTGYSSLSYLHHFPVDALKIDRSFVRRMNDDNDKFEIVKLIIAMAHNLKMNVVAEGVETIDQYEKLSELDCEYLQGFFFSKPISVKDTETFLRQSYSFSK